jgi:hypothetical protein
MVLACWRGTSLRGGAAAAGFTPGQQLEVLVCQDSVRFCQTCSFVCGLHCRTGGIVCHGNRHPCAAAVSKAVGACVLTQAQ